jgi:hypothetical protein
MDPTQIILIISISLITATIVYIGVWIVNVLRELRTSIQKANIILDDAQIITSSVSGPISSISEFVMGFKNGLSIFNSIFPKKSKQKISPNEADDE